MQRCVLLLAKQAFLSMPSSPVAAATSYAHSVLCWDWSPQQEACLAVGVAAWMTMLTQHGLVLLLLLLPRLMIGCLAVQQMLQKMSR
jgi:hypothetical protein